MKAEEIGGQEAKLIFSYDEVAQLAALAIKHSANQALIDQLESTYAVMGAMPDAGTVSGGEVQGAEPYRVGGSRADEILDEEAFERIYASRPESGVPKLRPPKPIEQVTAKDILTPKEMNETIEEDRTRRAAAQAAKIDQRKARNWRRDRRTLK
jgi:hypothetical protein